MKIRNAIIAGLCLGITAGAGVKAADDQGTTDKKTAFKERMKKAQLEKYDADKDGQLSDAEKKAMYADYKAKRQANALKKYDANSNGVLDPEEKAQQRADAEERKARKAERDAKKANGQTGIH